MTHYDCGENDARSSVYREPSEPFVKWKHPDGPMLVAANGQSHFLTYKERFLIWIGKLSIQEISDRLVREDDLRTMRVYKYTLVDAAGNELEVKRDA